MSGSTDFYTTADAARRLGVTQRRVQQMLDDGSLARLARGLVDAASLDRYATSAKGGRTRVWSEHTAWGAVALLSRTHPSWLGPSQASRLRQSLRASSDAVDLVTRVRGRAVVRTYAGHPAARTRLQHDVVSPDRSNLGLVEVARTHSLTGTGVLGAGSAPDAVDGYLADGSLASTVALLGLIEDPRGSITLRTTGFDISVVRGLADSPTGVLAALDAATSLDPREQGVGRRALATALEAYQR